MLSHPINYYYNIKNEVQLLWKSYKYYLHSLNQQTTMQILFRHWLVTIFQGVFPNHQIDTLSLGYKWD